LRILVVYAHPLDRSFIAALHFRVVETLRAGGHSVDDCDLYAEKFDPVMSREQFAHYVDTSVNTREVGPYVSRLRAAEALVLVFPVWFEGLFHPNLRHLRRMAAVCTYGESRRDVAAKNNPAHRFVHYNIGALIDPKGRFEYLAHYDMNFTTAARRAAFLKRVTRVFEAW